MEVEYGINVKNKFDLLLDDDNDPEETVAEAAARAIIDVENREKEAIKAAKKAKDDAAIAAKPAAQVGKENRPDGGGGQQRGGRGTGRGGRGGNFAGGRGGNSAGGRGGYQHWPVAVDGEDGGVTGDDSSPRGGARGGANRGGYGRGAGFRGGRGGREFRRGGQMGGNVENVDTVNHHDDGAPVAMDQQQNAGNWGGFGAQDGVERPPRFEGRGGRGGGYNRARGGGEFPTGRRGRTDRISGSDKTGVKPIDKRHGSGRGNWGTQEDELTGETEALADKTVASDGSAEHKNVDKAPPPPPAPEEKTLTLDEWKKMQTQVNVVPQFNVRKPAEPKGKLLHTKLDDAHADEETGGVVVEKRAPKKQTIALDFKVAPSANSTGDGGRGGGGGYRGGRGGRGGGFDAGGGAPRTDRPDFRGGGRGGRGGRGGGGMEFSNTRGGGQRAGGSSSGAAYAGTALKLDDGEFPALG